MLFRSIYKAFYDLKETGIINKLPRLVCVQAENSDAVHNYIQTGKYRNALNPNTVADSISVSAPSNAYMAAKSVKESGGFSVTVTDDEIMTAQKELAMTTGIFAEPSCSSVLAALKKSKDKFDKKEQIVLLITGSGLKDIDSALKYFN